MNPHGLRTLIGFCLLFIGLFRPAHSAMDMNMADQLFPTEYATHVAKNSGNWFDSTTWNTNTVPGSGALVHIPGGKEINYEGNGLKNNPNIFMIRVDGELTFRARNGADTRLRVDTIVTDAKSKFRIYAHHWTDGKVDIAINPYDLQSIPVNDYHTDGLPVTSDWSADKTYVIDDGSGVLGRYAWDPEQLSLGIVTYGLVSIWGKPKIAHAKASTVNVRSVYTTSRIHWKPGETVLITGTRFTSKNGEFLNSHAEFGIIKRSSDSSFGLKRSLKNVPFHQPDSFDESLGKTAPLLPSVANITRNVIIRSAVATDIKYNDYRMSTRSANSNYFPTSKKYIAGNLSDGTHPVTQRGHFMIMGDHEARVRFAGLLALGRTDKTGLIDDFKAALAGKNRVNNNHPYITRYVNDSNNIQSSGVPNEPSKIVNQRGRYSLHLHKVGIDDSDKQFGAQIVGNVMIDSVGWGYVQHSSEAFILNNIAYDTVGAAFISETGDETGLWYGNLAVKAGGAYKIGEEDSDPPFAHWSNDVARNGTGFWNEGRGIAVINNIASGVDTGFVNQPFGIDNIPMATAALKRYDDMFKELKNYYKINFEPNDIERLSATALAQYGRGLDRVMHNEFVPIRFFVGNEVYNASRGLQLLAGHDNTVRKFNDAWSYLRDFTAWQVRRGVSVQYTSKYVFDDFSIKGPDPANIIDKVSAAIWLAGGTNEITFNNTVMENFYRGFWSTSAVGTRVVKVAQHGIWSFSSKNLAKIPDRNDDGIVDSRDYSTARGAHLPLWEGWDGNNPAYNAENKNFINYKTAHGTIGRNIWGGPWWPTFYRFMNPSLPFYKKNTSYNVTAPTHDGVVINLTNRSRSDGLNATWREHYKTKDIYTFDKVGQEVPLAFQNKLHARVYAADARGRYALLERKYYNQLNDLNDDMWSGLLLEFDKKTGFGMQRFAYNDFVGSWGDGNALQTEQTHNERIIFTRDQINATLTKQGGYYTLNNNRLKSQDGTYQDAKFIVMDNIFTDPTNGMLYVKKFVVLLDEKWCIDVHSNTNVCSDETTLALNTSLRDVYNAFPKDTLIKSNTYTHLRGGRVIKRFNPI